MPGSPASKNAPITYGSVLRIGPVPWLYRNQHERYTTADGRTPRRYNRRDMPARLYRRALAHDRMLSIASPA